MMKTKTTFKGLLLAALLLGGASSAWADMPGNTFTVSGTEFTKLYSNDYESDQLATYGEGWAVTVDDAVTRSAASSGYALQTTVENSSTATFTVADCATYPGDMTQSVFYVEMALHRRTGKSQRKQTAVFYAGENVLFTAYVGGDTDTDNTNAAIYDGTTSGTKLTDAIATNSNNSAVEAREEVFHRYIIEYNGTETYLTITAIDGTQELPRTQLTNAGNVTKISTNAGTDQANRCRVFFDNMWIGTSTASVPTYAYTVNYKEGETIVKTVSDEGHENALIPVLPYSEVFYGDDMTSNSGLDYTSQKFFIIADVAPVQQITSTPANNVLNIPVRRPYSSTLTVTRYFDNVPEGTPYINGTALNETDAKVANWVYTFPYYDQKDSKWYKATLKGDGNDKFGETGTFTNTAVAKTIYYTYDGTVINFWDYSHSNIVNNINYSGGSKNDYQESQTVGTLTAGYYEVTVMQDASYNAYLYKDYVDANDKGTQLGSQFTSSNRTQTIELDDDASNVMIYSGGNSRYDYVLIRKIPSVTVPACDALGYTFSSKYPLDFTGKNIKAYIATYTSGDVVRLKQVNKVPANTGLLIFSDSELTNQSIPTTTAATDDVTGNVLVAQSTTGNVAQTTDTKTNYVLGLVDKGDTSKGVAFLKIPDDGQSVGAGKAYLSINYSSVAPSRLTVVFEDETTGLNEELRMKNEEFLGTFGTGEQARSANGNDWYNLAGQRVTQPTKGLYIVNGKKVVIK